MNIIIIQENGHHEANRNFRECFCLKRGFEHHGANVTVWGKGHDNYEQTLVWEDYDLIFAIENWDWMPDLSEVSVPKFIWAIDAHCKGPQIYESYGFDKVLHATRSFAQEGCWLPNCYDDSIIHPLNTNKVYDLGFCGNIVNRGPMINYLVNNLNMHFDEMVIGSAMVEAINSYKIHWNANISVDVNYRNFETMGCQVCLLTSDHPDYQSLGFIDKENCLIWSDLSQLIDSYNNAIKDESMMNNIAKKGYELVKARHTYKHRANTIMEMI